MDPVGALAPAHISIHAPARGATAIVHKLFSINSYTIDKNSLACLQISVVFPCKTGNLGFQGYIFPAQTSRGNL